MTRNVFLQNGGQHNIPINSIRTAGLGQLINLSVNFYKLTLKLINLTS